MSVASALNLTRDAVQAIIVQQWPGWAGTAAGAAAG